MHVVGYKWVFKVIHNSNGFVQKYKVRLIAKGFQRTLGVDYFETFSLVVKFVTIRVILSIDVSQNWVIHKVDVNNAFLNKELTKNVYMSQPKLFIEHPENLKMVCNLHKALHGLKKALKFWFKKLKIAPLNWDFIPFMVDTSLFIYSIEHVVVYMGDILLTSNDTTLLEKFISQLNDEFALKYLGPSHFFKGFEVIKKSTSLHLSQANYAKNPLVYQSSQW